MKASLPFGPMASGPDPPGAIWFGALLGEEGHVALPVSNFTHVSVNQNISCFGE